MAKAGQMLRSSISECGSNFRLARYSPSGITNHHLALLSCPAAPTMSESVTWMLGVPSQHL